MLADTTLYSLASTDLQNEDTSTSTKNGSDKIMVDSEKHNSVKSADGKIIYLEGEEQTPDYIYWIIIVALLLVYIVAIIVACCLLVCKSEQKPAAR